MANNTVEKWQEFSNRIDAKDLIKNINNLPDFQIKLADIINSNYGNGKKVLEVGCEFGLTSFILNDGFDKYLLDFDEKALEKSKIVFDYFSKKAKFLHQDMFNMNLNHKFDIIFNAGVLEHFTIEERTNLLAKYSEFLEDSGLLILAIPNHYNFLYRLAYFILNLTNKWSFPKENKIYDMHEEIDKNGLILIDRVTVDRENVFNIWGGIGKIMKILFGKIMKEGYLTILIIKKP